MAGGENRAKGARRGRRLKVILVRLCLVGVFAAGMGLVCELAARMFLSLPLYTFEKGMFVKDDAVGYRLQHGWEGRHAQPEFDYRVRTNSWGWRGPEPNVAAARRVLVIGDSIAFGQGVADGKHMCDLARSHLAEQDPGTDLLNASAPGYCLINELAVLKELLPQYRPLLVVQILCFNDLGARESMTVEKGYLVQPGLNKNVRSSLRLWLNQHCHLFCLVKKVHYIRSAPTGVPSLGGFAPYKEKDHEFAMQQLTEMNRLCQEAGARFVVFVGPVPGTLGPPQGWLEAMLKSLGEASIPCRNPGATISPEGFEKFIFLHDRHWNEAGCKMAVGPFVELIEEELGRGQ